MKLGKRAFAVTVALAPSLLAPPSWARQAPTPAGVVVAWHADLPGTPPLGPGWQLCDGSQILDPSSPFEFLSTPDLNGERRFLRGGLASGVLQDHALQQHGHVAQHSAAKAQVVSSSYGAFESSGFLTHAFRVGAIQQTGVVEVGAGAPRTASETRPANVAVTFVLATRTGSSLPIGAIVAWHPDHPAVKSATPIGWVRCEGGTIADPDSPYAGTAAPTFGLDRRFLRGTGAGVISGATESDAFQAHTHHILHDLVESNFAGSFWMPSLGGGSWIPAPLDDVRVRGATSIAGWSTVRTDDETRPSNMSAVWLMKTRASAPVPEGAIVAWHRDLAPTSGPPRGWYACDGGTVTTIASPYHGATLPDLNGTGRFLRGDVVSGILEEDALQDHGHSVQSSIVSYLSQPTGGNAQGFGDELNRGQIQVLGVDAATANRDDETRPRNMSVVWLMHLPAPVDGTGRKVTGPPSTAPALSVE